MTNGNPHTDAADYVTRSFVLPRDQDEALKKLAALNHRTFSGEMRLIVEGHLAANAQALKEAA